MAIQREFVSMGHRVRSKLTPLVILETQHAITRALIGTEADRFLGTKLLS